MYGASVRGGPYTGAGGRGEPQRTQPSVDHALLTQWVATAVWKCVNTGTSDMRAVDFYRLLAIAPQGVLDLTRQPSLSREELGRLADLLATAEKRNPQFPLHKLILGNIDDVDGLFIHWRHLRVDELDLSRLRVRCGEGFQGLSIRQLKQLQNQLRSPDRTTTVHTIVLDENSTLRVQVAQCPRLGDSAPSGGGQTVFKFVSLDHTALEREAMAQRAFNELLQGGFTQAEVDALLEDPCFVGQRELNLAVKIKEDVGWDGLAMLLASKACPLRHLVLPPPDHPRVQPKLGLICEMDQPGCAKRFIALIVGTAKFKNSDRTRIESIRLEGWRVDALKVLWYETALRHYPVDWYLVSGTPLSDFRALLSFLELGEKWRVVDANHFTDAQMKRYRHEWWMRLMQGILLGPLDTLLAWPEFGGSSLSFLDRDVIGYCSRPSWLALAEVLRHPHCRLDTLAFHETDTPAQHGGRAEFLSTFVRCGRKLDLQTWHAEAAALQGHCERDTTPFGPSDVEHLASLPVPQPAPVIVLSETQIQELKIQLEPLVLRGWVFEDPAGRRLPAPAVVDPPALTSEGSLPENGPHPAPPHEAHAQAKPPTALRALSDGAFASCQAEIERLVSGGWLQALQHFLPAWLQEMSAEQLRLLLVLANRCLTQEDRDVQAAAQFLKDAVVSKQRWSSALEGYDSQMLKIQLQEAEPTQLSALRIYAGALSELDCNNKGTPMPDQSFGSVQQLVKQAVLDNNEAIPRGALVQDGQYKSLSLEQCRTLVRGPDNLSSQERQAWSKAWLAFVGHTRPAFELRRLQARDAFHLTWNVEALRQALVDDPSLSPSERVVLNDRARMLVEKGRNLLELLDPL